MSMEDMPFTRRATKRQSSSARSAKDSGDTYPKRYKAKAANSSSNCAHEHQQPAYQSLPNGKRLLPNIVEELAATDPQGVWLSTPSEPDSADVFRDIDYTQLDNAVNRAAWWIHDKTDASVLGPQTLAYMGPTDSRYLVLVVAAIKAGHRLLLPSSRNAESVQRKLLQATNCTTILCAESERLKIEDMLRGFADKCDGYTVHSVPEEHEILDPILVKKYVYVQTFETERHNTFVVLHTSGTGGEATPVSLPHAYYAYEDTFRDEFANDGVLTFAPLKPGSRCLYTGPLYHAGAILFTLMKGLLLKVTMLLPPAGVPVTAEVVESCLINGRAEMLGTAPSVLEELCSNEIRNKCLRNLSHIFCGSGPMPKAVGYSVRAIGVSLLHIYGSTETALLPQLPLDDPVNDWQYFRFHPASGAAFVAVGKDELYELVIRRVEGHMPQPCFKVFPALHEYHTQDTFTPHPFKLGLWKFEGRIDDIITLTNGEKFCPSTAEGLITSHPCVSAALIVGQGRFQPTLILDNVDSSGTVKEVLESVWPVVEQANSQSPGYAQIGKGFVIVSKKGFLRTPKGTIRRHATAKLHQAEVDNVYKQSGYSRLEPHDISDVRSLDSLRNFLYQAISTQVAMDQRHNMETNLFALGLDSLHVAALVSLVSTSLGKILGTTNDEIRKVRPQMFYQNRSISRLALALHSLIDTHDSLLTDSDYWEREQSVLLEHYTRDMSRSSEAPVHDVRTGAALDVVLLTGSTGSLGKHLLHVLLGNAETSQVYCIDRSPNAMTRYLESFPGDRLQIDKAIFLQVPCLDAEDLGVTDSLTYTDLFEKVTSIIHSAWPVNFHLPLQSPPGQESENASFESHIAGVRRLIDFSAAAPRKPQLIFISSLASILRFADGSSECMPETIVEDPTAPVPGGYGRSKWLAELMLDKAAKTYILTTKPKIIRIGQISGPSPRLTSRQARRSSSSRCNPAWPVSEMIPSMIRSSATVKALPASLHAMEKLRWMAVDDAAQVIMDIATSHIGAEHVRDAAAGALVYNAANIQSNGADKTWGHEMRPIIQSRLERMTGSPIEIVSLQEWLHRVEMYGTGTGGKQAAAVGHRGDDERQNPAMRLIAIFEELVGSDVHSGLGNAIETERARRASRIFRELQPVSPTWMEDWMAAWGL